VGAEKVDRTKNISSEYLRPNIGLLTRPLGSRLRALRWLGVADAAKERGANLICYPGGILHDPKGFGAQANVLYDLVDVEHLDGLIVWGVVGARRRTEEYLKFIERYTPLPIVSVSMALEGIPSVLTDNYDGMGQVVAHMIEAHDYQKIVYIKGIEGFEEHEDRYQAYQNALTDNGLVFNPTLVVSIDDTEEQGSRPTGKMAIQTLLNERNLQPTVDFDAIIANDDVQAIAAMEALIERGISVPDDIAVASFDNDEESKYFPPPLTTTPFPSYKMGRQAADLLMDMLENKQVPEQVIVPTNLIIRQSCGCPSKSVVEAGENPVIETASETSIHQQQQQILSEILQTIEARFISAPLDSEQVEQVFQAFVSEFDGESQGPFLLVLRDILDQTAARDMEVTVWNMVLSTMRSFTLPYLPNGRRDHIENLWQQARVMVGETAERIQAHQKVKTEQQAEKLRKIGQALITTFDMTELMDVLAQNLPQLGISSCYLSLYEDPQKPAEWAKLMLAYDKTGHKESATMGWCYPSPLLLPEGILSSERQTSFVVEPLYFRDHQLGFALFEVGPRDGSVYMALRGQISSALQGALLMQERQQAEEALEKAYTEVEQQVEERTAELQREVAERERLQQEMINAQKRAIQELSSPVIPVMDASGGAGGIIVLPLIGSIDSMRGRDITRSLLAGISQHKAKVAIIDVTGVPIIDSGVANHLNKTIQAAQLKGTQTIITGISEAVAETIVDLGIDWSGTITLSDLQTGLRAALAGMGLQIAKRA
jgi:DNA-binding LacI/PurR family transcriptional regulator/anti-anti-sigma regulatory factor